MAAENECVTTDMTDELSKTTTASCEIVLHHVQSQEPNPSNVTLQHAQENKQDSSSPEESGESSSCGFCFRKGRFTTVDAIFVLAGMALYIADLVTDVLVGVQYLRQGDILWSIMTFVFVFVPSLVLQYFSFRWFILDMNLDKEHKSKTILEQFWAWCKWLAASAIHVLQLGALERYWRTFKFGMLSRTQSKYYQRMIVERLDITMLRLLEAFMESAPQLVLQVYIMVEREELYWLTAASAIVSLLSLAFSLSIYQKALRDYLDDKDELTYCHVAVIMTWRIFTITARVIAMALFASIYEWWIFVLAAAHWVVMTGWLIWQNTAFHESKYDEIPFDAVIGIIHIFCFFNMKEGPTRYRAVIFYILILVENTIMFGLWYSEQESRERMYGIPALVFVWGGFFIGIFFMSVYYYCCHPTSSTGTTAQSTPSSATGDTGPDRDVAEPKTTNDAENLDTMAQSRQLGATTEVDHVRDKPDGQTTVDSAYVERRDNNVGATLPKMVLSERDRYRYLFSYQWRRRIHPKVLVTKKNSNAGMV